ncbi:hypothetical protein Lepto7375DRAFT_2359 [Leptolyngbya sp. PCC 7375]|nr:hypothetical protein Lepto7375DRAFT_7850 [Leptolyngbya sp. PCC 7375]EKV00254.1 hypothetical protein Lepto7375DRAFT_2359 [Leptolyngbya sp. PCC 7375]
MQTVIQFRINAMLKIIIPLSIALASSVTISGQALSCYMETAEGRIDLSHMCGDGSTTNAPATPTAPPPQRGERVIVAPVPAEPIATFQVQRINRETGEAYGIVRFSNEAPMGTVVRYWADVDGVTRSFGSVVRERGHRNIGVEFWLPAGTSLNDIENEGAG